MPGFSICLIILDIWKNFEHVSNNMIIITTNIIVLDFLFAWFVYSVAPQLTNLFFFKHELGRKNKES